MKKLAYMLLLLPSLASAACPVITGNFHCEVKKLDTGTIKPIDIRIKTADNVYTLSTSTPGIEPMELVADGVEKGYLAPVPDGFAIHTKRVSCEGNKMHLVESQQWYHDITPEEFKPGLSKPSKAVSVSEFLSLDSNDDLVRDDTWTKSNPGGSTSENIPMVCPRIKEETK